MLCIAIYNSIVPLEQKSSLQTKYNLNENFGVVLSVICWLANLYCYDFLFLNSSRLFLLLPRIVIYEDPQECVFKLVQPYIMGYISGT